MRSCVGAGFVGLLAPCALLLAACAAPGQADDLPVVHARAIALERERPERRDVGRLRFEAGYVLSSGDRRFGGLSGIWLAQDGSRMIAASDRGTFWLADLRHDGEDRLTGFANWRAQTPGRLPGDAVRGDAEALAEDGRGGLVVAYEGRHRLRRLPLDDLGAEPAALPVPDALARPSNTGIEALANLAEGRLLALSEGLRDADGDVLGWIISERDIEDLTYVSADGFVPTGASRLGDTIYLLERRFSLLQGGFAGRIVRFPADRVEPGARVEGEQLARLEPPVVTDNYEAIAARRARDGRTLLYLLTDDNFHPLQRTLMLQFSVAP